MNVSPIMNAEQQIIYEMDDVLVATFPGDDEISLVFRTKSAGLVQKDLPIGGPKHLSQIAAPSEASVKFWYDPELHAWVIVHSHQMSNGNASTIFIPDNGEPYIRNGSTESVVPHDAPSALTSVLRVVGLTSLMLTLCQVF